MSRTIAIIGTLDTKSSEMLYLKKFIEARGFKTQLIDVSMLEHEFGSSTDIKSSEVAIAGGSDIREISTSKDRNFGTVAMGRGLRKILSEYVNAKKIDGVISAGGAQGTSISSTAMKDLPIGFPKLIVSAVASGNIRPFVGAKDIAIMFSVADINGGINPVTQTVLSNAAAAVMGMVKDGQRMEMNHERQIVGITSWGTTQRAVIAASDKLRSLGYDTVIFHSSGACTSAMEDLIEQGVIDGVLDLTTHDFLGEIFPQELMPPVTPGRLANAAKRGIPLVVAPGGLSMFVMGPYEEVTEEFKRRPLLKHNPSYTEVRLTLNELLTVAKSMAERLNATTGYCAFLVPLKGWNDYDADGSPLYNPEEDALFIRKLRELTDSRIEFHEFDGNLNEESFGKMAAELLAKQMGQLPNPSRILESH
ncbi:MAG: Tm-1-like ATP-binding domain-containing protein [Candidatus Bathyarchaeia archaeon]